MRFASHDDVYHNLVDFRQRLQPAFGPETSVTGRLGVPPSAGHCAVVAILIRQRFGGEFASAMVNGESHWFNRLPLENGHVDVDITGDQFGYNIVQVAEANRLYPGTRVRREDEVREETRARATLLAQRAGLAPTVAHLDGAAPDEGTPPAPKKPRVSSL